MVVLFIVIGSEVLQCLGARYCDYFSPVELTRMWQLGLVEVMSEGILGGVAYKIWRRVKDRLPQSEIDKRQDVLLDNSNEK